ncbi:hypothetical protein [Dactylosporangium darangshiense]|uniref:hypothetical protein n=1 Tax=Dactylosporangium darangshiense TaxID=579108 RepID=UPI0036390DD0
MHDPTFKRLRFARLEGWLGRGDLAAAARLELVSGVVHLRPEDAMFEAMLRGWQAQQVARGLREDTIAPRERLVRRFAAFANAYPWQWGPQHMDEWTLSLTGEHHLAPSTIRGYQTDLRLFSEYVTDGRYGWATACEEAFGPGMHPVAICHEWNTIAHLNEYEGRPEGRPMTREELQLFLDFADDQVERAVSSKRKGALAAYRDATLFKVVYGWGCAAPRRRSWIWSTSAVIRRRRSSAGTGCCMFGTAKRCGASRRGGATSRP